MDQKSWFYEKINALMPILSKNFHSQKSTLLPFPYFVKKKRPFSQKRSVLMSFFLKYNMENPGFTLIFDQKKPQLC